MPARRVDILGCPFDAISFDETMQEVEAAVREQRRLHVVPGNVDQVMKTRADPSFRALLQDADLVIADGVPITWAASLLGTPLKRRVSGTDFVWFCGDVSARLNAPVALMGAGPGIAARAAEKMEEAFPGAKVVAIDTPMKMGPEENAKVIADIRAIDAKIVLAALGAPRQERWIRENLEATGAYVGAGIGSAFDIISGHKPRAPAILADNGLEWLHRMVQEPRRLGRRYLVENSPFLMHLAREVVSRRFSRTAS